MRERLIAALRPIPQGPDPDTGLTPAQKEAKEQASKDEGMEEEEEKTTLMLKGETNWGKDEMTLRLEDETNWRSDDEMYS